MVVVERVPAATAILFPTVILINEEGRPDLFM
jgi:hypothetical protein